MNGWVAVYKDGTTVTEQEYSDWRSVPNKKDIIDMGLMWRGQIRLMLKDKYPYTSPSKRGACSPGSPMMVLSRAVGYYENDYKIYYRVDEKTGKITVEKVKNNEIIETTEVQG